MKKGNLINVDFSRKEEVWKTDFCAGCEKDMRSVKDKNVIKLPFEKYDEFIALCKSCYREAKKERVL
ncbi:hypothetical protein LF817_19130 [Halobacillus sp. A1]|uniref:hypothetical protein n=1 Tax=Halobacillus sp. A1 TaxID=2880262 RepID=UPI0020A69877|nr:hypothetical protein [Halobacillus sp. A1]MCP3033442.1 hypothetical protein [Halobacillus sp. A1]